jgi:hypothetical protein
MKELLGGPGAKDLGTRTGMLAITGKRVGKPERNWPVRNWVWRSGPLVIMKRILAHTFCFGKELILLYLFWPNLEIPLNPGEVKLNWIGRHRWHNGFTSWFSVEVQGQKIYMTADVDKNMLDMIFLTMDTPEVYERLNNLL